MPVVQLFDGSRYNLPEGTSDEDIDKFIYQKTREIRGIKPESGGAAALKSGIQSLLGAGAALAGRTGLMDVEEAQRAYEARKQRAEEIFQPSPEGWSAPLNKIAELAGSSLPYMALPIGAGLATMAAPVTGVAATALGLGAAGLTSAAQFTGTNLARQMETGKQLRETDLGAAGSAAVFQALLDTAAMRMIPGVGKIFGQAGVKVTKENAEEIAKQALSRSVRDYAISTGRAMTVEGVTEASQQALERLQAGLSISDPEARAEYFESFVGGAVLGGVISPVGRYVERSGEQRQARGILKEEADQAAKEQRDAEEAEKKTPEYLLRMADTYNSLAQQKEELRSQIIRAPKGQKLSKEDAGRNALINAQLKELAPQLEQARKDYNAAGGAEAVNKLTEQRAQAIETEAAQTVPQETQTQPFYQSPQATLPGMEAVEAVEAVEPPAQPVAEEAPEETRVRYEQDIAKLAALLDEQRVQMSQAESPEDAVKIATQAQKTKAALDVAQTEIAKFPEIPQVATVEKTVTKLEKQLAKAKEEGDQDKVLTVGEKLIEAKKALAQMRPDEGLFAPEVAAAEQQRRDAAEQERIALGEAMGAGREAAGYERQQAEIEQQVAREDAAQVVARQAEADARAREAPQLEMFTPPREQVTRTTEAPKMTAQVQTLQTQLEALQKRSAEVADDPARAADVNKQIAAIQTRLDALTPEVTETARVGVPLQEAVPERSIPPTLPKQVEALAARVVASPRVDEDTKAVVRQIQDDVPAFLKAVTAQAAQSATEMRQRAATAMTQGPSKVTPTASAETFTPQQAAAWLYRTLNTGRADPADTARVQSVLQRMQPASAATEQPELPGIEPKPAPTSTPAPTVETKATREAKALTERKEAQARLERGEASAVQVFFEQNKPDIMADTNYTALVERSYDTNLPAAERMQAATEADKYMQAKAARIERRKTERSAAAQLHEKNLNSAKAALTALQAKLANAKNPEAVTAQITAKQRAIDKHQRLLNTALTGTRIERFTRGDLNLLRERVHQEVRSPTQERAEAVAEVQQSRVLGERLGIAEGTQKRATGPVTRQEVFPPREMRTGSEESRAGATTTAPNTGLREARGQKQRDTAITKAEMAEAEQTAAPIREVRKAKAEEAKQRAEAAKAEVKAKEDAAKAKLKAARKKAPGRRRMAAVGEMEELEAFGLDEISLSRGPTAEPSTVASLRAELGKVFPDLGRVQMYESVEALIKANPQYEGKIPSDARGFVDTAGNKAFLIAENIDKGKALSVLLHEVGSHVGLKNTLGSAQYNALVKAVEAWEKKADGSVESRVAQAARAKVEAAETEAAHVDDELLAYAIEEAVNAGVKPFETKSPLGQWLSRIAQAFRKVLEKFGLPPKALDAQALVDMAFGAAKMEMTPAVPKVTQEEVQKPTGEILFSRKTPKYAAGLDAANDAAKKVFGPQRSFTDKIKANLLGFRAQIVDAYDSSAEALIRANVDKLKATQAMYYLRMYNQRMHFTSQAVFNGAPERRKITRKDGRIEYIIQAKEGANIAKVVEILKSKDVVKAAGSADAADQMYSLYRIAKRAENVGYDKLNFKDPDAMRTAVRAAMAQIEANPTLAAAFKNADDIYNQYNRDLLSFLVDTGALNSEVAARLVKNDDYVPYYRVKNGMVDLMIGGETPIRVGNVKDSPHLKELVGGDEPIVSFLESSVQNTSMLIDMAMQNLAMKNLMNELKDAGLATIHKAKKGAAPQGAVTFKVKGEEHYAIVNTESLGIDSELLVKGLAGIPTMFPAFVRVMGVPSRLLRRMVVASPVYMARQLVRDSTTAALASGANILPIIGAVKQIGKYNVLEARGITGGQTFTGMPEDMTRILKDMQSGKISLTSGLAWLETQSAKADALTRKAQYDSYIEQGLSEMEATLAALESMNFTRRGLSPTIHMLNTLIPFLNSQIQGLDVLYRAFTGKMPMNEQLEIRRKLIQRGLLLAGMSFAYALAMQDDEAYKNAKPEEKYSNWFVNIPGLEQPLRVPIPFELGYIFKSLPEALVNIMAKEEGGEEALKAFKHIGMQTVPGLSSYFLPQGVKPALEAALNTSIFTGRGLESARDEAVEPGERYRDNTSELARMVGSTVGYSPIKLEYLIRGYTGGMGMALIQALSLPFSREGAQPAEKRLSDLPVIGTAFQPTDASGIIDATYETMKRVNQKQDTYKRMLEEGRTEEAREYLDKNIGEIQQASLMGRFKQRMGEITTYENKVKRSPDMTPQQKRKMLDDLRQAKIELATAVREAAGRTTRQASLA